MCGIKCFCLNGKKILSVSLTKAEICDYHFVLIKESFYSIVEHLYCLVLTILGELLRYVSCIF